MTDAKTKPAQFFKEDKVELQKVVWPSKQEAVKLTALVIGITIFVGFYIGVIDYILSQILEILI